MNKKLVNDLKAIKRINTRIAKKLEQITSVKAMTTEAMSSQAHQLAVVQDKLSVHQQVTKDMLSQAQTNLEQAKDNRKAYAKQAQGIKTILNEKKDQASLALNKKKTIKKNLNDIKDQFEKNKSEIKKIMPGVESLKMAEKKLSRSKILHKAAQRTSERVRLQKIDLLKLRKMKLDELKILKDHQIQYPGHYHQEIFQLQKELKENKFQLMKMGHKHHMVMIKKNQYAVMETSAELEMNAAKKNYQDLHPESKINPEAHMRQSEGRLSKLSQKQQTLNEILKQQRNELHDASSQSSKLSKQVKSCQRKLNKIFKAEHKAKKEISNTESFMKNIDSVMDRVSKLSNKISNFISKFKSFVTVKADNPMASAGKQPINQQSLSINNNEQQASKNNKP